MKRLLLFATAVVVAIGLAAPYLDLDVIRPKIEQALERGLGRRVEVRNVSFNLFTGPGFTLREVTIHEDPRAGIEPFAFVRVLKARVRLLSLFSRRLEFSSLLLGIDTTGNDTTINLVKTYAGPWNFQFLLGGAPAAAGAMPSIRMRDGRVNFKFGDTKSVFYFNHADFDVSPSDDGSVALDFSGAPSRTDRAAQNFGNFFVRGTFSTAAGSRPPKVDMRVELERSALDEVAHLIDRRGFGLHGVVALDAQLSGPTSQLEITGQFQVDDVHRWDLLPKRGGGWRIGYKGTLDLRGERLELESTSDTPNPQLALQFRAWDFLSKPHWDAAVDLKQIPLSTLVEVARHMGVALTDNLTAEGSVSGAVRYSDPEGLQGRVELQDASLTLPDSPDAQPLRAASAAVAIAGHSLSLENSTVRIGETDSADVAGSYTLGEQGGLDLTITTRSLSVADLRSFGLAAIPLLEQTPQGAWRGWARYRWTPGAPGEWLGDYELQNARIAVDGLADPVRIQSAAVTLNGARVAVSRLRAKVGAIAFTGDYRWEPTAVRPHKFHIEVPKADSAELERILAPVLVRERGFLARTLRLGSAPLPEWLKTRRADGTFSIRSLSVGDSEVHVGETRLLWDGAVMRLAHLGAQVDQASVSGELEVGLDGFSPHYRFEGKLQDFVYKGGKLDFEGSLDADGSGPEILATAHGEGRLHGGSIAFAPDADFRNVSACFEVLAGPRWKLSNVEVVQGAETYTGTGATQADGRLVLDILNRGRPIRYTSGGSGVTPQ
jgi:hypothetical protein